MQGMVLITGDIAENKKRERERERENLLPSWGLHLEEGIQQNKGVNDPMSEGDV